MAPTMMSNSSFLMADAVIEKKIVDFGTTLPNKIQKSKPHSHIKLSDILWINVMIMITLHVSTLYAGYLVLTGHANFFTYVLSYMYGIFGGFGITCGAHRLWAHRSYRANYKLRLLLAMFNLIAYQNSIYSWVRDHRSHHKFTDTDADPHNARRGLFFSHIGWLMVKKHPDVGRKGATLDMTDLKNDPIVMFQKKYYALLMPTFCFVLPTLLPMYILNESLWNAWFVAGVSRYVISLHSTWLVNSVAHKWGTKPIDSTIPPTNNTFIAVVAFGEGWHNYHHVFPWDYKTSELGDYSLNLSTAFIDFFAKIGWAYDLKTASKETIEKRSARTGDGSRKKSKISNIDQNTQTSYSAIDSNLIWGWDDTDMNADDKKCVHIINEMSEMYS